MKRFISGAVAAATLLSAAVFSPGTAAAEPPVLKADSSLVMAKDGTYVFGTGGAVTVEKLAAEFEGEVTVKNPVGDTIDGTKKVPTGSTVNTEGGAVSVLVVGDANIDGNINLNDVSTMLKSIAKWSVTIDQSAADADVSGKINLTDVSTVLKHIAGWDVKLGNMKIVVDENPVKAANEDAGTKLWTDHGTSKVERSKAESTGNYTYVINAAKNENEGATIYISPSENKTGITVSVTDFVNCYGDTVKADVFTLYYHNLREVGYMPDAMMPTDSNYEAKISAGNSQAFYVRATTTEESEAGLYEATVTIKENGTEIKRANLYLNVWDFTLDDSDAPRSSFGLDKSSAPLYGIEGTDIDGYNEIYKKHYDMLLDHRICAYILPFSPETDEADVYLNNPRVNSFVVYGSGYGGIMNATIEQLQERYEKLSQNEEWYKNAYFYCADEPYDIKNSIEISNGGVGVYQQMRDAKALIDTYFPGGKQVVPLEAGSHVTLYDGFMQLYRETTDILCPKTYAFVPQKYYGTDLQNGGIWQLANEEIFRDYGSYANFADQCLAEDENKESWWYFAGLPAAPFTTYHASVDGMYVRMSGFQMYQEDVTGVLYYATQDYRGGDLFHGYGMDYMTGVGVMAYGNGILLFPGARFGLRGPIGSVRLEYICDSFEDYMYLKLVERTIGKEEADALVLKVTRDLVDFETDAAKMQAVRAEIAEAIMAAKAE